MRVPGATLLPTFAANSYNNPSQLFLELTVFFWHWMLSLIIELKMLAGFVHNLEKLDPDFLLLIQLNNFDSWLGRVPVPSQKSVAGLWLAELHHLTWTLASDWSNRRGILGPHVFAWSILCQHCKQENIHYLQYLQFTAEIVNSGCSSQMTGVRIPSLDFNCHDIEQGHCSHDRCSKPYRPPSTILPSFLMGPN